MKIHVTWSDIWNGKAGRTNECMVALALKRELGVPYASVGYGDVVVANDGERAKIYLPATVKSRIKFWDRFHIVFPFQFELLSSGFLTREEAAEGWAEAYRGALRCELARPVASQAVFAEPAIGHI